MKTVRIINKQGGTTVAPPSHEELQTPVNIPASSFKKGSIQYPVTLAPSFSLDDIAMPSEIYPVLNSYLSKMGLTKHVKSSRPIVSFLSSVWGQLGTNPDGAAQKYPILGACGAAADNFCLQHHSSVPPGGLRVFFGYVMILAKRELAVHYHPVKLAPGGSNSLTLGPVQTINLGNEYDPLQDPGAIDSQVGILGPLFLSDVFDKDPALATYEAQVLSARSICLFSGYEIILSQSNITPPLSRTEFWKVSPANVSPYYNGAKVPNLPSFPDQDSLADPLPDAAASQFLLEQRVKWPFNYEGAKFGSTKLVHFPSEDNWYSDPPFVEETTILGRPVLPTAYAWDRMRYVISPIPPFSKNLFNRMETTFFGLPAWTPSFSPLNHCYLPIVTGYPFLNVVHSNGKDLSHRSWAALMWDVAPSGPIDTTPRIWFFAVHAPLLADADTWGDQEPPVAEVTPQAGWSCINPTFATMTENTSPIRTPLSLIRSGLTMPAIPSLPCHGVNLAAFGYHSIDGGVFFYQNGAGSLDTAAVLVKAKEIHFVHFLTPSKEVIPLDKSQILT